jgi:hypothetical protein
VRLQQAGERQATRPGADNGDTWKRVCCHRDRFLHKQVSSRVQHSVYAGLLGSSLTSVVLWSLLVVLLREYFREYLVDGVRASSARWPVSRPECGW